MVYPPNLFKLLNGLPAMLMLMLFFVLVPLFAYAEDAASCPPCDVRGPVIQLDRTTGTFRVIEPNGTVSVPPTGGVVTSRFERVDRNGNSVQRQGLVRGNVRLRGQLDGSSYVVAPGDVLWQVAYVFDTTVDNLVRANALTNQNWIEPGQRLTVRIATAPSTAPVPAVVPAVPAPVEPPRQLSQDAQDKLDRIRYPQIYDEVACTIRGNDCLILFLTQAQQDQVRVLAGEGKPTRDIADVIAEQEGINVSRLPWRQRS